MLSGLEWIKNQIKCGHDLDCVSLQSFRWECDLLSCPWCWFKNLRLIWLNVTCTVKVELIVWLQFNPSNTWLITHTWVTIWEKLSDDYTGSNFSFVFPSCPHTSCWHFMILTPLAITWANVKTEMHWVFIDSLLTYWYTRYWLQITPHLSSIHAYWHIQ